MQKGVGQLKKNAQIKTIICTVVTAPFMKDPEIIKGNKQLAIVCAFSHDSAYQLVRSSFSVLIKIIRINRKNRENPCLYRLIIEY